jgi:hypothetical protein
VELEGENHLIPVAFQGTSAVDVRWDAVPAGSPSLDRPKRIRPADRYASIRGPAVTA